MSGIGGEGASPGAPGGRLAAVALDAVGPGCRGGRGRARPWPGGGGPSGPGPLRARRIRGAPRPVQETRSGSLCTTRGALWRRVPSMSTFGRRRSSQRGRYQACAAGEGHDGGDQRHPDQEGVDEHADGEPEGDGLDHGGALGHERAEHEEHDERGRGDDPGAVPLTPAARSRGAASPVVHVLLAHAGDQEHLVVHGESEQDRHQQDRQEAQDRAGRGRRRAASASQPHWNTATTTPNEAATDSRKPRAALIGTSSERNTIVSSSTDSPTTMSPNGSSAALEPRRRCRWRPRSAPVTATACRTVAADRRLGARMLATSSRGRSVARAGRRDRPG